MVSESPVDKRCNNHRRIVAYGVLNCATSATDHAKVDPGSYRFWVRNDSVLTTTCGSPLRSTTQFVRELLEAMRQRASIRDDHWTNHSGIERTTKNTTHAPS